MVHAVASAAGSVLNAAKAALSFLSPNKLGDDPQKWGLNFGTSFAAGLLQSVPGVAAAAKTVLMAVKSALGGGALSLAGSVTGNTGASVAGANQAGLTALLSTLVAEMHQLPPNFQAAGMQVVAAYKDQLAKLYDQMIAKETREHEKIAQQIADARKKEAEAEIQARH